MPIIYNQLKCQCNFRQVRGISSRSRLGGEHTIANRPQPAETCHAINAGLELFLRCVYINFLPMLCQCQGAINNCYNHCLSTLADPWFSLTGGNHRGLFEGVEATQHCDFLHPSHGICFPWQSEFNTASSPSRNEFQGP